jgi:ribosomal protein S18 acetylase RimI-like enzyme
MTLRSAKTSDAEAIAAIVGAQNEREGALDAGAAPVDAVVRVGGGGAIDAVGWLEPPSYGRTVLHVFALNGDAGAEIAAALVERAPADTLVRIERVIRPETVALPAETTAFYSRLGLEFVYVELEMVRELSSLPVGAVFDARIERWTPELDAALREVHNDAFSTRGFAGYSEEEWQSERTSAEDDFLPDASRLAFAEEEIVGFVMCSRDGGEGWMNRVGVRPAWRGRGIVDALMVASMRAMRDGGMLRAVLRVNEDNPGAQAVYRRHGFEVRRKHVVWRRLSS